MIPGSSPRVRGKPPPHARPSPSSPAHPRVCGENWSAIIHDERALGSSPRVRGKPRAGGVDEAVDRLIPACAGKTTPRSSRRTASGAHPRVCGENVLTLFDGTAVPGSSPRVRGKPVQHRRAPQGRRLIPACAGKTNLITSAIAKCPAHPRACGENERVDADGCADKGSSPRVRGKLPQCVGHGAEHGLIPACAGKTLGLGSCARGCRAHPRVCGENAFVALYQNCETGSSPRVRGKPELTARTLTLTRLIPARAGKTSAECGWPCGRGAHPRACGENPVGSAAPSADCGSSPRVRGKRRQRRRGRSVLGLIPARAGKTRSCAPSTTPRTAHPRACGENRLRGFSRVRAWGSSPRVRGKPVDANACLSACRLIPARAGKTDVCDMPNCRPRAHPRACGENAVVREFGEAARGSSPRVRGKRRCPRVRRGGARLIPARAGKTDGDLDFLTGHWAHPRACGENEEIRGRLLAVEGSSPRVRGKPRRSGLRRRLSRLIPARAGKTNGRTAAARSEPAHPRACGENVGVHFCVHFCSGSSPRVRGKHRRHSSSVGEPGLIPARAGKTGCSSSNTGCPRAHPRACGENRIAVSSMWARAGSSPRVRGKLGERPTVVGLDGLIPARAGKTATRPPPSSSPTAHPRACGENPSRPSAKLLIPGSSPRVRGKPCLPVRRRGGPGLIPARAGKTRTRTSST